MPMCSKHGIIEAAKSPTILAIAGKGSVGTSDAEPLARAFETFVLMYQSHAAREDTIVFPAWKDALSERQLHEMGDRFEDIEHRTFGKDGFDDAVGQIGEIERALGLGDIAQFTAPPPPRASDAKSAQPRDHAA